MRRTSWFIFGAVGWLAVTCWAGPTWAVEMTDDPNGFQGITWGTSLTGQPDLKPVRAGGRFADYEQNDGPPHLDSIPVEGLKFVALEGKFARVTIRYRGEATHKHVIAYLEQRYGPLDKTPGQMVRGLNQQYNWRGQLTEINLTYEGQGERGFVFFDSRKLAPLFIDGLTDSSE